MRRKSGEAGGGRIEGLWCSQGISCGTVALRWDSPSSTVSPPPLSLLPQDDGGGGGGVLYASLALSRLNSPAVAAPPLAPPHGRPQEETLYSVLKT